MLSFIHFDVLCEEITNSWAFSSCGTEYTQLGFALPCTVLMGVILKLIMHSLACVLIHFIDVDNKGFSGIVAAWKN